MFDAAFGETLGEKKPSRKSDKKKKKALLTMLMP